jgi:putative transcriptional regulator
MSVTELADKVGITMANISVLKNGKAKAIRYQHWRRSVEL